jgi:nicotinic acid mononucleotide adenylyltransferase
MILEAAKETGHHGIVPNAQTLIAPVTRNVLSEIHSMRRVLGGFANDVDFTNLQQNAMVALLRIERLIDEGKIAPLVKVRHSAQDPLLPAEDRELHVGVFPTAANPLHWGHLLGGLITMERFFLDKVIFVIAGQDPRKPEMAPEHIRHAMAKEVLRLFYPLFEYSAIAFGTATSGEDNFFRILGMSPNQSIHAYYIAGDDHYRRFDPATGRPDTIQKLEEGMNSRLHGFDGELHKVSAVFLQRGSDENAVPTSLDVRRVDQLPIQTSSTEIRWALEDRRRWQKLYTLPFDELVSIFGNKLYRARHAGTSGGAKERYELAKGGI